MTTTSVVMRRVRHVGPLAAAAAFAVVGVAACSGGDQRADSREQASTNQADTAEKAETNSAEDSGDRQRGDSAYCSAVENFNGTLAGAAPSGGPGEVQDSLGEVSDQVSGIIDNAPNNVVDDWKKLRTGFDQLNESYDLLDGIDEDALQKLQSASTQEEVDAIDLARPDAKKYEQFQQRTSKISSEVESSGEKVSQQVEQECDITIGTE